MNINYGDTVGSIVAKDYRMADVFKGIGINYWYEGHKTVMQSLVDLKMPIDKLGDVLRKAYCRDVSDVPQYNQWDLDFLADHVVASHHRYAKKAIIRIYNLAQKLHAETGESQLVSIIVLFCHDFLYHLKREEHLLFPAIKALVKDRRTYGLLVCKDFDTIKETISMMQEDHKHAASDIQMLRKLTNDYTLSYEDETIESFLCQSLHEFENDLALHVHLENNILFSKILLMG